MEKVPPKGLVADFLSAALDYVQHWQWLLVLPLAWITEAGVCGCNKGAECTRPEKHPLTCHGFIDASRDEAIIKRWGKLWPLANIGIHTGWQSSLFVVELLELIRADLKASPFQGEGHRKVWAGYGCGMGVKVGRRRVLRLMRENNLLSPATTIIPLLTYLTVLIASRSRHDIVICPIRS